MSLPYSILRASKNNLFSFPHFTFLYPNPITFVNLFSSLSPFSFFYPSSLEGSLYTPLKTFVNAILYHWIYSFEVFPTSPPQCLQRIRSWCLESPEVRPPALVHQIGILLMPASFHQTSVMDPFIHPNPLLKKDPVLESLKF